MPTVAPEAQARHSSLTEQAARFTTIANSGNIVPLHDTTLPLSSANDTLASGFSSAIDALVRNAAPKQAVALNPDRMPTVDALVQDSEQARQVKEPSSQVLAAKPSTINTDVTSVMRGISSQQETLDMPGSVAAASSSSALAKQMESALLLGAGKKDLASESAPRREFSDIAQARLQDSPPVTQSALLNTPSVSLKPLPVTSSIPMQLDSGWPEAMSERVAVMLGRGEQSATLQLAPEELGKLQLRISMNQGATQIEVHAQKLNTVELMESMLPRLQASLDAQGIRLDDVKFSQQPLPTERDQSQQFAQEQGRNSSEPNRGRGADHADSQEEVTAEKQVLHGHLDLARSIDHYA